MATYYGNKVYYGSGSWFRVRMDIWDSGETTGPTCVVAYRYELETLYSLYDSSNDVHTYNVWDGHENTSRSISTTGGTFVLLKSDPNRDDVNIYYTVNRKITFQFDVSGLAGVSGTSSIDVDYSLPRRQPVKPDPPGTAVSSISASGAYIKLTPPSDNGGDSIEEYRAYVLDANAEPSFSSPDNVVDWHDGSFTASGLEKGTDYWYSGRARNSAGWSDYSPRKTFMTSTTIPDAPATPTSEDITDGSASVRWVAPDDNGSPLRGFVLQVDDTSSSFGSKIHDETYGSTSRIGTIPDLDVFRTYYARVRTWNGVGYSGWSNVHSFTTLPGVPNAVGRPTVSNITGHGARISWPAVVTNGSPMTNYRVEVTDLSGAEAVRQYWTSNLWWTISDLTANKSYSVAVRANSALGYGPLSAPREFRTRAGVFLNVDGAQKEAEFWVCLGPDDWRPAEAHLNTEAGWVLI